MFNNHNINYILAHGYRTKISNIVINQFKNLLSTVQLIYTKCVQNVFQTAQSVIWYNTNKITS